MLNSAQTPWCYFYNTTNTGFVEGGKCPSWHTQFLDLFEYKNSSLHFCILFSIQLGVQLGTHLVFSQAFARLWPLFGDRLIEPAAHVVRCTTFNNPAFKASKMLQLSYNFTYKTEDGELKRPQCWIKQHELKANWTQKVTERCVSDIVQWQQRAEEQLQLFTGWFHHSCSELRLSLSPSLPLQSRLF